MNMSDDERSSFAGSASEAEEDRPRGSRPEGEEQPEMEAEAPKKAVPRRPKLDAERILEHAQGIMRVYEDFPKIEFRAGAEVANLDLLVQHFSVWASQLYPYGLNLQDFAKTCETELYPERHRRKVFDLRAKYVRKAADDARQAKESVAADTEMRAQTPDLEDEARQAEIAARMEENRQKALERRRQRELQQQQ